MVQPDRARRRIGFRVEERRPVYRKPGRVRIRGVRGVVRLGSSQLGMVSPEFRGQGAGAGDTDLTP